MRVKSILRHKILLNDRLQRYEFMYNCHISIITKNFSWEDKSIFFFHTSMESEVKPKDFYFEEFPRIYTNNYLNEFYKVFSDNFDKRFLEQAIFENKQKFAHCIDIREPKPLYYCKKMFFLNSHSEETIKQNLRRHLEEILDKKLINESSDPFNKLLKKHVMIKLDHYLNLHLDCFYKIHLHNLLSGNVVEFRQPTKK